MNSIKFVFSTLATILVMTSTGLAQTSGFAGIEKDFYTDLDIEVTTRTFRGDANGCRHGEYLPKYDLRTNILSVEFLKQYYRVADHTFCRVYRNAVDSQCACVVYQPK